MIKCKVKGFDNGIVEFSYGSAKACAEDIQAIIMALVSQSKIEKAKILITYEDEDEFEIGEQDASIGNDEELQSVRGRFDSTDVGRYDSI